MVVGYKGFLFDFDGTLAKTMEDNFSAWHNAFSDYGISIAETDYYPLEGRPIAAVAEHLCAVHGLTRPYPCDIVTRKEHYYQRDHTFSLYPGVLELIPRLKKCGARLAIVTAAERPRLDNSAPREFLALFDTIVCGSSTPRGKPFPDPYLAATARLGLRAEECLVVENAPLGILSAKSAHLYCIALCSTVQAELLAQADEVLEDFSALLQHPYFFA